VTGDELLAFVRRYKAKAVAGVVSAVSTAVVSTVISKVVQHQNKRPKAVEIVKTESESAESEGTTKEEKTNDEAIEGEFAAPTKTRPRLRNSVKVK
jgi:mannitol-specific phosphotransferase system IIBC component